MVFADTCPAFLADASQLAEAPVAPDPPTLATARMPDLHRAGADGSAGDGALRALALASFMRTTRVNVNVRQVLAPGQAFPPDAPASAAARVGDGDGDGEGGRGAGSADVFYAR